MGLNLTHWAFETKTKMGQQTLTFFGKDQWKKTLQLTTVTLSMASLSPPVAALTPNLWP